MLHLTALRKVIFNTLLTANKCPADGPLTRRCDDARDIREERAMVTSGKWRESAEDVSGENRPRVVPRYLDIGDLMVLSMQGWEVDLSEYTPLRSRAHDPQCNRDQNALVAPLGSAAIRGTSRYMQALR